MTLLSDEQLANIAQDYFLSQLNIADISKKYNLSRYLIAKSIEEAKDKGIVKISIAKSPKRAQSLENELQQNFKLKEAYILDDFEAKSDDNSELITDYAAKQIQNYTKSANVIGVTWETLLADIIDNFTEEDREDLTFVQLLGHPVNPENRNLQLVQEVAKKFNAQDLTFPAPLYSVNPKIVSELKGEPYYEQVENIFSQIDMLFSGIETAQSLETDQFFMDNYSDKLLKNVDNVQIAGMIFGRPYDINGNFYEPIDSNICGITRQEIMKVPTRFVVVKKSFKEDALLGALRSGVITHLVTSSSIAEGVLQKNKAFA